MIHPIPPTKKDRGPSWNLPSRTKGLGSGDAPVIMGVSPFGSLYNLWATKVGHIPREDISGKPAVEWGQILELPVAEKYSRTTSRLLIDRAEHTKRGRFDMRYSKDHKFMVCNLDYEVADPTKLFKNKKGELVWKPDESTFRALLPPAALIEANGPGICEVKTGSGFTVDKWEGEPPIDYQMQVQHQLAVTGMKWASIAVLLGGNDFRVYDLERDEQFIALLIETETLFWKKHIMADIPPPIDGSESTARALKELWPNARETQVDLSEEATKNWARAMEIKAEVRTLYKEKDICENAVRAELKDAMNGLMADGSGLVRYPLIKKQEHHVGATQYRQFFFRKAKE